MLYRSVEYLGKHATLFLALGVFSGFVVPALAHAARPLLLPALMIPLTIALLRVNWRTLGSYVRGLRLIAAALGWLMIASPIVVWCAAAGLGLPRGLVEGLTLMAASSPIFAGAALALIVGLDGALAIVIIVFATALVPFTLPPLTLALLGIELDIGLATLTARLAAIVGTGFAAAWIVRHLVRKESLERHARALDGTAVAFLVVFAMAIMDGVMAYALQRPGYVIGCALAALAGNLLLQALGTLVFVKLGLKRALTLGLLSGNCNMGLVLIALGDKASVEVQIFFGVAQVPVYILPALLLPVYRGLLARFTRPAASG